QRERAEATYLDAISRRQGIAHDLEDLLERELHILGGQMFLFRRDDFNELGLRHGPLSFYLLTIAADLFLQQVAQARARRRLLGTVVRYRLGLFVHFLRLDGQRDRA